VHAFLPMLSANEDGGHIVNTASMAGLGPVPGLGAYCVTKYGIVALTETLALELAEAGSPVGVTVLCPGPVRTNIGVSSRNRPAALSEAGLADVMLKYDDPEGPQWMDPAEVGEIVVDAIRRRALYAITHPVMLSRVEERHERILEAFPR
jgi:NAD(P)-dependent dehydrogenase (short-subunit alcohol dehydrogenase family)